MDSRCGADTGLARVLGARLRPVRFTVHHDTRYDYDAPVSLGEHVVRLTPQPERIDLHAYALTVEPQPAQRWEAADPFGNRVTHLRFAGETRALAITMRCELDTLPPPDLDRPLPLLPWSTADDGFTVYRAPSADDSVRAFAVRVAAGVGHHPVAFLDRLAETLHDRIDRHIRSDGHARTAGETLASGRGACRDVTVLYMEACRCLGLPARFVSGYQARAETPGHERHLHAWAEVYLPGAGWRGWDATHGHRVTDQHVAVCAAPTPAATLPVEGGFTARRLPVGSRLDYAVRIEAD